MAWLPFLGAIQIICDTLWGGGSAPVSPNDRVAIWPFLKLFARNKMVWPFLAFFEC